MSQVFVTSDTHFCHDKSFVWGKRGFESVQEMNEEIIKRWNSVIQPGDVVFLLGDVMLNDNEEGINCLKQLNGDIFIAIGNHDTSERIGLYEQCPNVVEVEYAFRIKGEGFNLYLTHYPTKTSNGDGDKPLKRRVINLCGHSHTDDPLIELNNGELIYHCEMEAHNCTPILLSDILDEIKRLA